MRQYELFINGQFIPNGDRKMIDVINPSTEEVISQVPQATAEDVAAAVDAAYEAQKSWAKMPAIERAGYLRELAQLVSELKQVGNSQWLANLTHPPNPFILYLYRY